MSDREASTAAADKQRYSAIYDEQGDLYDALVNREDFRGALLPAIRSIAELDGKDVVELGAGTGRLTRLLEPYVASLRAFDAAPAMLAVARRHLAGSSRVAFAVADHLETGVASASADLVVEGWAFGHATHYHPGEWRSVVARYVAEATRMLRPRGTLIVIETLGTGASEPKAPNAELGALYAWLEETGFARSAIRTDYRFPSRAEGERITRAFFRRDFEFVVDDEGAAVLPECTGLWWKRAP